MMEWQRLLSTQRLGSSDAQSQAPARTDFQRDYDRIIFSDAFRRLHDKTQVFPLPEDDHIHSRLTHSLEVACVGRSLGNLVGSTILEQRPELRKDVAETAFGDVVAAACLAHDIGNPPFGHSGENSLASWFADKQGTYRRFKSEHDTSPKGRSLDEELFHARHPWSRALGSDENRWAEFTQFEGNAQGFRILVRHQRHDGGGMRLTCATLAAFMKYPRSARASLPDDMRRHCKKHGFFRSELAHFREVAEVTGLIQREPEWWCRHPLAYLVEAADDVCYRILDFEDGYRLGYVAFEEIDDLFLRIAETGEYFKKDRYQELRSKDPREYISALRSHAINALIYQVKDTFVEHEEELLRGEPIKPLIELCSSYGDVKALKQRAIEKCYSAKEVLDIELAGYEVLGGLLDMLIPAIFDTKSSYAEKIRRSFSAAFKNDPDEYQRILGVTDFISGMTDSFAVGLYRRIKGIEIPRGRGRLLRE